MWTLLLLTIGAPQLSRRVMVSLATCGPYSVLSAPAIAADTSAYAELRGRMDAPIVVEASDSLTSAGRQPRLPAFMAGRWMCEQTLVGFRTPLGVQYIGAPGRPLSEAEASAAQTRAQIGKPVSLELRFENVDGGALEDKAFNARSRLDAFAGRPVVRSSQSCAAAGVDAQGIDCTFVDFIGPVSQKQMVGTARVAVGSSGRDFVSSEFTRAIFARRTVPGDTRNFPPITTDSETLLAIERVEPDGAGAESRLRGRLRLISYLQPYDPLYFAAGRKSVSISDYELELTSLSP